MSGARPQAGAGGDDDAQRADASARLGRSFKGAMAAVRRLRGRETHCAGELSDAQYGLLFGLCEHRELSSRELAGAADLSPASTSEMLDGLAAAGLVQSVRSLRDRRVVLTSLTERGRTLIEERRARYEPRWRAALADFSDEELLSAGAVLDSLRAMFDELAEQRAPAVGGLRPGR
ncbi:MAG: MarR family winged helix-turn-helix transcriptional regulator [Solirubrobacteraceae bacterium]